MGTFPTNTTNPKPNKETHEKNLHVLLLVLICQVVLLEKNPPILGLLWVAITYFTSLLLQQSYLLLLRMGVIYVSLKRREK
jgi:ribosomal protein L30/L7E